MSAEFDRETSLPTIEPSLGFARGVMRRIEEVEALRAQAAAQGRSLGVLWLGAALAAALGALPIGAALAGPLPGFAALGEVAATLLVVSGAEDWLPMALIAAGLALVGAAVGQVVPRPSIRADGRA